MAFGTTQNVDFESQSLSDITGIKGNLYKGKAYYVDGTNGLDTNTGLDTWYAAKQTIQAAITAASQGDVIYIVPKEMAATDTDPGSYAETLTITTPGIALVGVSRGRTQGGLPQIKKGSGSTALLTIRAPGCLIKNLGFNGGSSTGGGILLDDNGSTKNAFGTTIENCHFKNCVGSTATDANSGGAITWGSGGGAWQVLIKGCRFYKNVGDIVVPDSVSTIPQDMVIEDCVFSGPAASVDCNVHFGTGGVNGFVLRNCSFQQKPAISLGATALYISMATGSVGVITGCTFGCQTNTTGGTKITFKSGGTGGDFPTTVHIMNCYGQSITASESAEITIA